jgi:Flp pilus assembly pilin Flp
MRQHATQERGQTAAEYLGVLLLVALVVAALLSVGIGGTIASSLQRAVCEISGGAVCASDGGSDGDGADVPAPAPPPTTVDPQLTADERDVLLNDPEGAQDVLAALTEAERAWLEDNDPEAAQAVEAAISWEEERAIVDAAIDAPLQDVLDYVASDDRDPRLDYTTDLCSAPVVGSTGVSFDFTESCVRHDFGYRNTKDLGLFEERKDDIDRVFLKDMRAHCATRSVLLRGSCYRWAVRFYAGVRAFG